MPTDRAGTPELRVCPQPPTHRLPGMQARSPSIPQRLVPASPCNNGVVHVCSHQAHLPRAARTHKTEFTEACPGPNATAHACRGPAARGVGTRPRGEKGRTESGRGGAHSLRCCVQGRRALGVRGEAAQRTDRDVRHQGLRCGRQEPSARCELARCSFSQDASVHEPRSHPGACAASRCPPGRPPHPSTPQPRGAGTPVPPSQPLAPGPAVPPPPRAASSSRPGPGALNTSAWALPDPPVLTGGAAPAPCGSASPKPGPPEKGVP